MDLADVLLLLWLAAYVFSAIWSPWLESKKAEVDSRLRTEDIRAKADIEIARAKEETKRLEMIITFYER